MNSIEKTWVELLELVFMKGKIHHKDDSEIKEVIGVHKFIKNVFPVYNVYLIPDIFLELIKQGKYNINGYPLCDEALYEYVSSIDDKYMQDGGDFVYTYPERLMNYVTVDKFDELISVDQMDILLNRLENNKGSNRSVAVLYNPGLDGVEEHIPCLNWLQVLIRDDELMLSVMFRSNDVYGAWPSNMLFLNYVGLKLVDCLRGVYPNLVFSGIDYHVSSLHYYKSDEGNVLKILKRS